MNSEVQRILTAWGGKNLGGIDNRGAIFGVSNLFQLLLNFYFFLE